MDELAATLLDRLIEKTMEALDPQERVDFVERLFNDMSPANQERFLRRLLRELPGEAAGSKGFGPPPEPGRARPPIMRRVVQDHFPRNIGPWRMCCRMMVTIDKATRLDTLDTARPAQVFSALGDETRVKIIKLLSTECELRVDDLTGMLDTPQSTVSHHLRVLKETGLVEAEKRGRNIYYSIAPAFDGDNQAAGAAAVPASAQEREQAGK